jgi:hypothetical protein
VDYALYDLFNGSTDSTTIHTRAGFVKAVEATTVVNGAKRYAINFQDAVWDKVRIPRTVTQNGDELEFTVRGAKLTADITIGPASSVPGNATMSQFTLQDDIRLAQHNFIGAGTYWIESFFYNDDLRSGATAAVDGTGVLVTVYGPHHTASILVTPTH